MKAPRGPWTPAPVRTLAVLAVLACAAGQGLRAAPAERGAGEAPPPVPGMELLFDNGRSFSLQGQRLPLRCLDAPDLLALAPAQRVEALDRAASAGFNAVSFEAPLFGPRGLIRRLGRVDDAASLAFTRTLEACAQRRIYAFPVLYPPTAVDGLIGTATARSLFFSGRNAQGWESWALRQLAALRVRGRPLVQVPVVGGFVLYRGPWPGGPPLTSGTVPGSVAAAVAAAQPADAGAAGAPGAAAVPASGAAAGPGGAAASAAPLSASASASASAPASAAMATATATATALDASREGLRLRAWATWTVKVARKLGFVQELGIGFWPRDDLGKGAASDAAGAGTQAPTSVDSGAGKAGASGGPASGPPLATLSEVSFSAEALTQQSKDLDVLPPVPGSDAEKMDDSDAVPAAPPSPWDLDGLDWGAVEALLASLPTATQLNFVECTLDSEDWYRVGGRLAEAAEKAEVPVLWRQDWRSASRFERGKRLAAPPPLAGLSGPWPEDDWPADGDSVWPLNEAPSPSTAPFHVRGLALARREGKAVLEVKLTRPASLTVEWGAALPLAHEIRSVGGAKALHHIILPGLAKGAWVLLRIRADSPRFGACLLRTRWIRAPL